jgi:hypothetical protein
MEELHRWGVFDYWDGGMGFPNASRDEDAVELWRETQHHIWKLIKQYTDREFTNPSDILDGFLGILAALKVGRQPADISMVCQ